MKRELNNKGQMIIDFQATLAEDFSNTTMMFYSEGKISHIENTDYDRLEKEGKFITDKPFYGAKITDVETEAETYLKENFNTEMYNGKLFMKLVKRKYMARVFPPMFYGVDRKRLDGVIPKGSVINVRAQEETYIKAGVEHKKLTILGAAVIASNTATEKAEVYCADKGGNVEPSTVDNTEVLTAIEELKKQNQLMLKVMKGLVEHNKELKTTVENIQKDNEELKQMVKTLQVNNNSLQLDQDKEETMEDVMDFGDFLNQEEENSTTVDTLTEQFEDDIPF